MSAFSQFVLIALVIYLWESGLWLPLRSVVLRRSWRQKKWKSVRPGKLLATQNLGLVPLLPFIPDTRLAPCQSPPLLTDSKGRFIAFLPEDFPKKCSIQHWDDLQEAPKHLTIGGEKIRISSPRSLDRLRKGKRSGESLETAVRAMWRQSFSPTHAKREWRRWKLCSGPLIPLVTFLTLGFFVLLPLTYLYFGVVELIGITVYLWLIMAAISARLWWISKRVYPGVKAEIRADALLCLVVPFHAMRAIELTAVHAMAPTHPVGLLLANGDIANPWLARFCRELNFPHCDRDADALRCSTLIPMLDPLLAKFGKSCTDYDVPPDRESDPDASAYCPRCHALYQKANSGCDDCGGIPLREF